MKTGILLTEETLSNYLADLETYITQVLIYKSKKLGKSEKIVNDILLTDSIPYKDFKSKFLNPNLNVPEDEINDHHKNLFDRNKFLEIA